MKKIVLLAVLGALAWWVFIDGSKLDEALVRERMEAEMAAFVAMDADAICAGLASDYSSESTVHIGSIKQVTRRDKEQSCADMREFFRQTEMVLANLGGELTVDLEIKSITISPDRESAEVEVRSVMRIADMKVVTRSAETIVREHRRLLTRRSVGRGWGEFGG